MSEVNNYKSLKSKVDFVYKGIHLNRVMALHLWGLANSQPNNHLILKRIIDIFFSYDPYPMKIDKPIFSTFGKFDRKDHQQLYYNVMEKLGENVFSFNMLRWKRKIAIHPFIIWKVLCYILPQRRLSIIKKIKLATDIIFYCNLIEELERIDFSKVKRYLCMYNVLEAENLLTQYMRTKGIPSYSLMEGMYIIHRINPPIDCIQYENFETDNLLSWGQYTKDEFVSFGISPEKIKVAGYPKKVLSCLMRKNNPFRKCVVLLARSSYHHSNVTLLDILRRCSFEYQFFLKPHPISESAFYSRYAETNNMIVIPQNRTMDDCLVNEKFDFAIAVNTTVYYEALMHGIPCLRFTDGTFEPMAGYDDVFATKDEFETKLKNIKKIDQQEYQQAVNKILAYTMGIGIDKYAEILCE